MRRKSHLTIVMFVLFVLLDFHNMTAAVGDPGGQAAGTTPADLGISDDGTAPMLLTDDNGEPLASTYQVVSDGMNEKYRIAEDATNVSISEHSVAYNTDSLVQAGIAVSGPPQIQWAVTNNDTGQTQDAGSGSTTYTGVLKTPGHYNLANSGITPTDTVIAGGSTGINSGTDVELEVTDITAPSMKVSLVPEDRYERNYFKIEEDPDNLDAYPITAKTAKVTVSGRNWTRDGAAGKDESPFELTFKTAFGMVSPEEQSKVADSKVNPDIKAKNDYTVDRNLDQGLEDGFYVPVSVRTSFKVEILDDNDPREPYRNGMKSGWQLEVVDRGNLKVYREPPDFIFRKPNVPAGPDSPRYTLVAEAIDGSGNKVVCRIPINVLPKNVRVTDLEQRSKRH